MGDSRKLIEVEFPLKETSLNSVYEKNMRHGHISTLHIWPARRPLAASRAALLCALLDAPEGEDDARTLARRIGGTIKDTVQRKKMPNGRTEEVEVQLTEGGILRWLGEASDRKKQREKNRVAAEMTAFREELRRIYGRAPRVADVFAGGGAIPLEAMRLGCEVTAVDINPVAWLLLRCTLEYPQRLAGQKLPLPEFALQDSEFLRAYLGGTARPKPTAKQLDQQLQLALEGIGKLPDADLAWHVRAWGWWVLQRARADLEKFYPAVDGKQTVAYLWARTVKCRSCRAMIPLLKTRWLCRKAKKRVLLHVEPELNEDRTPRFRIETDVPVSGGNAAQRREHDRKVGQGTMSGTGATCPYCRNLTETGRIREEGRAGRLDAVMTAVVYMEKRLVATRTPKGTTYREIEEKAYRLPTEKERRLALEAASELNQVFGSIPLGIPDDLETERLPVGASRQAGGSAFTLPLYGFECWASLFTPRQLLALGAFVKHSRAAREALRAFYCPAGKKRGKDEDRDRQGEAWVEAVSAYLAIAIDRLADRGSSICHWDTGPETIINTFQRFALQVNWDYSEANPFSDGSGSYSGAVDWIGKVIEHTTEAASGAPAPHVLLRSAKETLTGQYDAIVTDPPYYDAIPYSALMSFFHVWLRRALEGLSPEYDTAFREPQGPTWSHDQEDGEFLDDPGRYLDGSSGAFPEDRERYARAKQQSKTAYETSMGRAFKTCRDALTPEGRFVVVFANKSPGAWEALVAALIRAGFVVSASWPIQTEMGNRTRAHGSSALSSSVWLVCKPRPSARPGWDGAVLEEMRRSIRARLRRFWDADIQGPDFVWAAVGPALESYSRYPFVRRANSPNELLTVQDFLRDVRRLVVEYAVGRLLEVEDAAAVDVASGLDPVTEYYLLHRKTFRLNDAPAGACILYAQSCGIHEMELVDKYELMKKSGGKKSPPAASGLEPDDVADEGTLDYEVEENEPEIEDTAEAEGTGSEFRLLSYGRRKRKTLGQGAVGGAPAPLIDQIHRLMQLHDAGDVTRLDSYIDRNGLARNELLRQVMQAIRHLAEDEGESEEARLLDVLLRLLQERERTGAPALSRPVQGVLSLAEV